MTHLNCHKPKQPNLNSTVYFFLVIKDSRPATTENKRRFARQRGLLLEKLEDFKRQNKLVRQKLKQLQESEVGFPPLWPHLSSPTVVHSNKKNPYEFEYLENYCFYFAFIVSHVG